MTDEAKPPNDGQAGASKRPRKPGAKKPAARKPAAKKAAPNKAPAKKAAAPSAAEATAAAPSDEAPTAIVAADETPTQVAPPGGDPAVPPPAPPFTPIPRAIAPSGGGSQRSTLWLVLALAAAAVVVVVLIWAFALRDSGEHFAGNWAPADGGGGGLVISLNDGDFTVAMYDEDLELLGSYPAARDGDVLTFRYTDTQTQLGMVKAELTYIEERDALSLRLTTADSAGAAREYARVDALEAAATPTPVPTPTPTPTASTTMSPSPSASPTGSASPTPSPSGTGTTQLDQQVVDGIVAIQVGILNWSAANGNTFPLASEVTQGGAVGQYVATWPTNPFTGQPMTAGSAQGDYTYQQLNSGQSYKLVGHLAGGLTFTVP